MRAAAWPLIRSDLGLTYGEIGLALAIPGVLGSAIEPLVGVLGDTGKRRAVILASGLAFTTSVALSAAAVGFWTLLAALVIGNPATSGFVSLSQATLMDLGPARRERLLASWTLVGSFGYVGGPVLLALAVGIGVGWRGALIALAVVAAALTVAARLVPEPATASTFSWRRALRSTAAALREREVLRWLVVLKSSDLLLDVFHGFLALYAVDVADVGPGPAAFAVAVWTGAGLLGDALLIPLLRRVPGRAYLRASALVAVPAYAAFLLVEDFDTKLVLLAVLGFVNAGWYAIPKAALYAALPGRSGAVVAAGGLAGVIASAVPALLGAVAAAVGLGAAMWALLLAPVLIVVLVPRR